MAGTKNGVDPKDEWRDVELQGEEVDACGLCTAFFSEPERRTSCGAGRESSGGPWRFMTDREFQVHKAMRLLREKAVRIKNRIRALEKGLRNRPKPGRPLPIPPEPDAAEELTWEREMAEELLHHCDRLAQLKAEWKEMDLERMAAQEERMRMLGHIQ